MSVSSELLCSFELLKPLDSNALKSHIKKGRNKRNHMLNSPVSDPHLVETVFYKLTSIHLISPQVYNPRVSETTVEGLLKGVMRVWRFLNLVFFWTEHITKSDQENDHSALRNNLRTGLVKSTTHSTLDTK